MEGNYLLFGAIISLLGLAGSSIGFVIKQYKDAKNIRRNEFFQLLEKFDSPETGLLTRLATIYRLREYKSDSNFLLRFIDANINNIQGTPDAVALLTNEMQLTAAILKKEKNAKN